MAEDLMELSQKKADLRGDLLAQRKALSKEAVAAASGVIMCGLIAAIQECKPKVVLSYLPYGNEIDTGMLHEYCKANGILVAVPVVKNLAAGLMEACFLTTNSGEAAVLQKSKLGVLEPQNGVVVDPAAIDLAIVPGVAFDTRGGRLGHGKGFYDRYLANLGEAALVFGVAYKFQLLPKLPVAAWDRPMKGIFTENGFWGKKE